MAKHKLFHSVSVRNAYRTIVDFYHVRTAATSDILSVSGISLCHPKILFRNQFSYCHAREKCSVACMNPVVLIKVSTRVVNWHTSNILGYREFSHNILCES